MVDIVDSSDVLISQAKSFRVGDFPQVRETHQGATAEISSQRIAALLIRE